jgi:hypothetical protein
MDLKSKLKKLVIPKLREASRYWPAKTIARNQAKVRLEIGKYKNGKPKYEMKYRCAKCRKLFDKKDTHADHIDPVVDPAVGFVDWNVFMDRLFCPPEGYQILCATNDPKKPGCHELKTKVENEVRKEVRKRNKKT